MDAPTSWHSNTAWLRTLRWMTRIELTPVDRWILPSWFCSCFIHHFQSAIRAAPERINSAGRTGFKILTSGLLHKSQSHTIKMKSPRQEKQFFLLSSEAEFFILVVIGNNSIVSRVVTNSSQSKTKSSSIKRLESLYMFVTNSRRYNCINLNQIRHVTSWLRGKGHGGLEVDFEATFRPSKVNSLFAMKCGAALQQRLRMNSDGR